MTPSQRRPAALARASTASMPASDSAIERLTFLRLWVSEADRKTLTSSKGWVRAFPSLRSRRAPSRSSSAASRPRSLGTSTDTLTSAGTSIAASTSAASASCGITSARTKLVTSRRRSPVRASASINSTLRAVGITSGSFWKPSRGPTSRMRTGLGLERHASKPILGRRGFVDARSRRSDRRFRRAGLRARGAARGDRRADRNRLARPRQGPGNA